MVARRGPVKAEMTPEARERAFWRGVVRALMMLVGVIRAHKLGNG